MADDDVLRAWLLLLRAALTFTAFAFASLNAVGRAGIMLAPVNVTSAVATSPLTIFRRFGVLVIGGIRHEGMSNTASLLALAWLQS